MIKKSECLVVAQFIGRCSLDESSNYIMPV
jgi:hypothetical protein